MIAAGRVGHDRLHATDVVGQPALDLAGPGLGEEAQGHPLEVGVQGAAQVLHDVLADDVVEVGLADPDQPGDDRQHDHQPDEQVELDEVALRDRVVDEELEEVRVDEPDAGSWRGSRPGRPRPGAGRAGRTPAMRRMVRPRRSLRDAARNRRSAMPNGTARRPPPPTRGRRARTPPVAARVPPRGNAITRRSRSRPR